MTLGRITSSQQDIVYVKVRPEDDTFIEMHNGTVKANYYILSSVGERFTAARWFGRIKIKIGSVVGGGRVRAIIYDSPSKTKTYYEIESELPAGGIVVHFAFDPLPPGDYYLEIVKVSGSVGISVVTNSTIHKAYKEGSPTTDWDLECKVMHVTDNEEERAIAVVGDAVDAGVTTISNGSSLGSVMVGVVERNISREGDALDNGGEVLTGCWFTELGD